MEGLKGLNSDILEDIMSRLDGSDMAAAACSFSDLRDIARDQNLWKRLCHSTWPSTASKEGQHLIPSSPTCSFFQKFYAESYPSLVLYNQQPANEGSQKTMRVPEEVKTNISPSDFASLVDVYYKNKCVFSRVIDGIPEAFNVDKDDKWEEAASEHQKWFAECPFALDLLSFNYNEATGNEDEVDVANNWYGRNGHDQDESNNNNIESLPSLQILDDWGQGGDICKKLKDDVRLSWVLLHKKTGKAVNLSSWKALLVQKSLPFDGEYMLRFGSIVPVDESVLPQQLAECVILARCRVTEDRCCMRWKEISLSIEDLTGARISGCKSLKVLNQALHSLRSNNHKVVEKGYSQYTRLKREAKKRKDYKDTLVDALYLSIEILVFAALWYNCNIF